MEKHTISLKIPCPNCGGTSFGAMDNPYCLSPSLEKAENGYELAPDKGLAVMPVICNTCGYIFLFHPS